jgi:hypothetical protein
MLSGPPNYDACLQIPVWYSPYASYDSCSRAFIESAYVLAGKESFLSLRSRRKAPSSLSSQRSLPARGMAPTPGWWGITLSRSFKALCNLHRSALRGNRLSFVGATGPKSAVLERQRVSKFLDSRVRRSVRVRFGVVQLQPNYRLCESAKIALGPAEFLGGQLG